MHCKFSLFKRYYYLIYIMYKIILYLMKFILLEGIYVRQFFKLKENGTDYRTEIIGGITTFLAMAYILGINPTLLSETGMPATGIFFATAIGSGIACIVMGLLSTYPIGLAPGMGINALFTYTIVLNMKYSWEGALAAVFLSNIIFLILTVSKIREAILNIIPLDLKLGIGAGNELMPTMPEHAITTTFDLSLFGGFARGFGELFSNIPNLIMIIFSLVFISFFDATGTLISLGRQCGFVDENGEVEGIGRALLSNALGGIIGSIFGTSTITTYIESAAGIGVGSKTGLTAVVIGILFILSIFISPLILSLFTASVTTSALIFVGILIISQLKDINWDDLVVTSSVFLTILMMVLTSCISLGMAWGFITYAIGKIATGKFNEINVGVYALAIVFGIYIFVGL